MALTKTVNSLYLAELDMYAKLWKNSLLIGKLGIVLITAAAITVSGADAAARLFSAYQSAEETNNYSFDQVDLSPSPGESSGEMATTGKPNAEPSGYLLVPLHIQGHSPDSWQSHRPYVTAGDVRTSADQESDVALSGSLGLISTELGHRQTLVGAKPSGTS